MEYSDYLEIPPITAPPHEYHSGVWQLIKREPGDVDRIYHTGDKEDCEMFRDTLGITQNFFIEEMTFEEFLEWEKLGEEL